MMNNICDYDCIKNNNINKLKTLFNTTLSKYNAAYASCPNLSDPCGGDVNKLNNQLNNILSELKQNIANLNNDIVNQSQQINQQSQQIYSQNKILSVQDEDIYDKNRAIISSNRMLDVSIEKDKYRKKLMYMFIIANIIAIAVLIFLYTRQTF